MGPFGGIRQKQAERLMKSDKLTISIKLVIDFLLTIGYNNFRSYGCTVC